MRVDPQILEEQPAVGATIDASHTDAAMRLGALNDGSWCFLEGYSCAFDKDCVLFSSVPVLSSVLEPTGPAVRGLEPLFDPFCMWGNEVYMNISQIKKLKRIVKINKLTTKNNKMFVCTMKTTLVNYRMSFPKQFIDEYVSNHVYGQEARKFQHLPPNSILRIATCITFCEAFLRTEPHFGFWLKVFCIKLHNNGSKLAACGGAMIGLACVCLDHQVPKAIARGAKKPRALKALDRGLLRGLGQDEEGEGEDLGKELVRTIRHLGCPYIESSKLTF
ncbi:Casein kinase I isoform delta-like protein [Hordeum vulgare]|nr:Casein kinase I isoform delta-like protein [Hordeum vulgare]